VLTLLIEVLMVASINVVIPATSATLAAAPDSTDRAHAV
jgi:hypothetical protein